MFSIETALRRLIPGRKQKRQRSIADEMPEASAERWLLIHRELA